MPSFIDFSGKKIGRVSILENVERGKNSRWKCLCDCGKEFICLHRSFKRGDTFECKECREERKRGIDLSGRKYGRWTVLNRELDKNKKTTWVVKCDCGTLGKVPTYSLGRQGKSMSCGCLGRKEKSIYVNETLYPPIHHTSITRIYAIRVRIIHSCYKPSHPTYKNFGEKGYTVCDLWRNGAADFFNWCIENHWAPNHVVAIKDGEKIFNPENCYILEEGEYIRQRMIKKIICNGVEKSTIEWAKETGLSHKTLNWRLRNGYSVEEAVFSKSHKFSGVRKFPDEEIKKLYESGLSFADIGRKLNFSYSTISKRLKVMNVSIDSKMRRKYTLKICVMCHRQYEPVCSKQMICKECKK